MFRAVNQLTFSEWTVETKDELLAELEFLQARHNPLDQSTEWEVTAISADGEILDSRLVTLPLSEGETVDSVFLDFGEKPSHSFLGWLKGIIKPKQPQPQPPVEREEDYEVVMDEPLPPQEKAVSEELLSVEDVLRQATLVEEEEASEGFDETIPEEDVTIPDVRTHLPEIEDEPVMEDVERKANEQVMVEPESPVTEDVPLPKRATETVLPDHLAVDVRRSSANLQQGFVETIDQEIAAIDALIERLSLEKENHLKLRQSLLALELS